MLKGRLNEKKFFQENSALQNLGPKIIHEPKNLKKKFRKKFFFENTATSKWKNRFLKIFAFPKFFERKIWFFDENFQFFLRIHWSPKFYHFCRNFYLQEVED